MNAFSVYSDKMKLFYFWLQVEESLIRTYIYIYIHIHIHTHTHTHIHRCMEGFPGGSYGKDSTCNAGDPGLILG